MIEWLFSFLVFYLLYKLIFDFIVPVAKASAHVKSRINQMNTHQQQTYRPQQQPHNPVRKEASQPPKKTSKDDYIDFEEVK